ncbi:MAG: right-handed parallel beta-helix repeat-containing protein [Deltaproteobacteria bacterium]|nr:right-handed parallel beta-helix repeat-containing protein [Deltaproteobacteria bacterium]
MKKALLVILGFLVLPASGWAQEAEPCEGFGNRILVERAPDVSLALTEYTNPFYRNPDGNAIWLCFELLPGASWTDIEFSDPLTLNNTSGLPVLISGLNIRGSAALGNDFLLSLSGADPVTVRNSTFSDCANCLSLKNQSMEVSQTKIACGQGEEDTFTIPPGGVGIKLQGEGHRISGPRTIVKWCDTGILIGNAKASGNNMQISNVMISEGEEMEARGGIRNNRIGIKVLNGQGNRFQQNSIYDNDANADGQFWNVEGIELAEGTNGGLGVSAVLNGEGDPIVRGDVVDVLSYEVRICDEEDWSADATIQLRVPYSSGEVEISLNLLPDEIGDALREQGKHYVREANCAFGEPDGRGRYVASCRFNMNNELKNKKAVALFHHPVYGSSTFSYLFNLNPCPPWLLSGIEMDAPEAAGGGGSGIGAATEIDITDDSDDEGSSMAANPIGGSSGSGAGGGVSAGGLGGSGAPGGGGCGGSINPNLPHGTRSLVVILLFAFPLAFLIGIRSKA